VSLTRYSSRQLQKIVHKESDIEDFFEKYGPQARDCYAYCSDLNSYHSEVHDKVKALSFRWDVLTNMLTSGPESPGRDWQSYRVLLVEPQPENRAVSRTRIVTKTVSQLLWGRDSNKQWHNHHQLFKTLYQEPNANACGHGCGTLLEPSFHALCVRGTIFLIHPMTRTRDSEGPINYKVTNKEGNDLETFVLGPQEQIQFSYKKENDNSIKKLLANHYYQPTAPISYDSFVYDPDSHQISAFQVMTGKNHGLTSKGIQGLHELGQMLGINDLTIRIIVVVLEGGEVTFVVEKFLYDRLGLNLKVYALEVTLRQLYDFD
jgi:hypothetical protein